MEPTNPTPAETIRYWDAIKDDRRWPLQVIQNTFAFGEDIPLRILKLDQLRNLRELLVKQSLFKHPEDFATDQEFDTRVASLVEGSDSPAKTIDELFRFDDTVEDGLKWIKEQPWATRPSNEMLLLYEFRQSPAWRLWEMLWLYHELIIKDNHQKEYLANPYQVPNSWLVPLALPGLDGYPEAILVAGPLLESANRRTGGEFDKERVQPAIDFYVKFTTSQALTNDRCERMKLAGHSRLPITRNSMRQRALRIRTAFSIIINTELSKTHQTLRRSYHTALAELAIFLVNHPQFVSVGTTQVRVDHAINDGNTGHQNWVSIYKTGEEHQLRVMSGSFPECAVRCSCYEHNLVAQDETSNNNYTLNEIEDALSDFSAQIYAREKAHEAELSSMFLEWMNEFFGVLTLSEDNLRYSILKRKLCARINEIIDSESATIFRYNYPSSELVATYVNYSDPSFTPDPETEKAWVMDAGADRKRRKLSICYRTIDDKKSHFTRSYNPETRECDPASEPLLPPADNNTPSGRSVITAPITIFGRQWGVLEIKGTRPYQFRWAYGVLVSQVSRSLSQFLYQQELLSRLHKINELIVSADKSKELELLCEVSKHLSHIFMSHGASIWIRDPNNDKRFYCKGTFNRPDIKEQLEKFPDSVWLDFDDPDSMSMGMIRNRTPWLGEYQGSDQLRNGWQKSLFIQDPNHTAIPLPKEHYLDEICHLTVIHISSSSATTETPPIATLSLYNVQDQNYAEDWDGMVRFVARHIALLLEAMSHRQDQERSQRRYIQHEIKQRVRSISNRGEAIARMAGLYNFEARRLIDDRRFREALKDLLIYSKHVAYITDLFSESEFTASLRSGRNPVIVSAEALFKEPTHPVSIREAFNAVLTPFYAYGGMQNKEKTLFRSRARRIPRPSLAENESTGVYRVIIHELNLYTILDNLVNNAIKYATNEFDVIAEFTKQESGATFTIKNVAPNLKPGERFRLTEDGFRGEWAEQHYPKHGEGKGLYLVKTICEIYGIEFKYETLPIEGSSEYCWHCQTLVFPEHLIQKTYTQPERQRIP